MQLVIVAGGEGTRLRSRLANLPKAMAAIGGRPLIEHQLTLACHYSYKEILLLLGHGCDAIRDFVGDGSRYGVRVCSLDEAAPLGPAGAVMAAMRHLQPRFLVMYGDVMLNVDLARFWQFHIDREAQVSLFLHPNSHPADSDLVEIDGAGRVAAFHPYPHEPERDYRNLVNAGLYVIEREVLTRYAASEPPLDFGKRLFPAMNAHGCRLFGYTSPEYIHDIGTPHRLDLVNADFHAGRIARGSFETPARAVFLDRDGTINQGVDRVKTPGELILLPGAAASIRDLNRAGWRVAVVTNQPVVARGDCTEAGLLAVHNRLETLLGREGAYLDRIYWCPHHPEGGFAGERAELKVRCHCRKPATEMIERARRDLHLDLARSWLVGDSTTDIQAARNAGVRSILVQTGHQGCDGLYPAVPDRIAADLSAAARIILSD